MTIAGGLRRGANAVAATGLALAVSACGSGSMMPGNGALSNFLEMNSPIGAPPPPVTSVSARGDTSVECPSFEVLDGTSSLRVGGPDSSTVRYQYSLGDIARECVRQGDQISIKVGVAGRVLIGPAGGAGSFSAPVRVAIRREVDHKPETSKLYQIPVTVPAGSTQGTFSLVTDPLLVPFIQKRADEDYTIVVGFDSAGGGARPVRARVRRH